MTSWKNDRQFKLVFFSEYQKSNNHSITFTVKKESSKQFQALLNNFLDFCKDNAKIIIETIDDIETNYVYQVMINIKPVGYNHPDGTLFQRSNSPEIQMKLANELRSRLPQFISFCSNVV